MANTPLKIEVTTADLPSVRKVFKALVDLSNGFRTLTERELEALPSAVLRPMQGVLEVMSEIDHAGITAQEGALRQRLGNLITGNTDTGTVEVADLRRLLEESQ